jgi:hypothetical protein
VYYQTILSRREELAAAKASGSPGGVRRDALAQKVRGQRQADIKSAALAMKQSKITELEETALVMEFATGVSMEQHYECVAPNHVLCISSRHDVPVVLLAAMDASSLLHRCVVYAYSCGCCDSQLDNARRDHGRD